jgi:tetratricopeptide (TPR) repeat protein
MTRPPEPNAASPEPAEPERKDDQHPLARPVTVAIVLVSLAIAAVGYLQVQASRKSNDAGQEAQRLATMTMSKLLSSQQDAQVQYELFLQSQDQRGRAGNAMQQSLFVAGEAKTAYQTEQALWQRLADGTQKLTPLSSNSQDGPQNDPDFPRHFFARSTQTALEEQASQDAANATNSAWESSAAKYTAILTLLAVALFLLGFALALPDQVLRLFSYVGVALLVVGVAWAIQIVATRPPTIPRAAAVEYAQGEVALETAVDSAGANVAIDHFTKAIDAWPDFSRAYLGRANATLFGSASQVEATLIPVDKLEQVRSDLEIAKSNGFDNGLLLEQLGGTAFSLGLHDQPSEFGTAADIARQAIAEVPDDPVARFTLAAALLGQGDIPAAEGAYTEAMNSVLYLHAGSHELRNAPAFQQVWVSGALSDLEAVAAAQPSLADEVTKLKEFVVGSFAAQQAVGPGGDATFTGLQVQLTPTQLFWQAGANTGYDPSRDRLSAEWYFRENGSAWVGMPEVSGIVDPSREPGAPGFSGRNLVSQSIPPRCVGTADYRVELYVNGHLAGQAEAPATFGSLTPFIDRSVNLEVCRPSDWKLADSSLPGFRDGLSNADHSQGVWLFRYNLTTLPPSLRKLSDPTAVADQLLTTTAGQSGLFPSGATAQGEAQHQPFQGLDGSTERVFAYPGGGAVEGLAGIDQQDQAVFVALVFGPQSSFQSPDAQQGGLVSVVQSISEYRPGGSSF